MGFFIDTTKIFNDQKNVIRITFNDNIDESNINLSGKSNKPSNIPIYVGSDERASHSEGRVKIYYGTKEESVIILPINSEKNPRFLNDKSQRNFNDYPDAVKKVLKQYLMDNREDLVAQCKDENAIRHKELQDKAKNVTVDKNKIKDFNIDKPKKG